MCVYSPSDASYQHGSVSEKKSTAASLAPRRLLHVTGLEVDLTRHLHDACAGAGESGLCTDDLSKGAATQGGGRPVCSSRCNELRIRMVEGVKGLSTKLELNSFVDNEVLEEGEVGVGCTWPIGGVAMHVAVGEVCWNRIGSRIEATRMETASNDSLPTAGRHFSMDEVGTLCSDTAGVGYIGAQADIEWSTRAKIHNC